MHHITFCIGVCIGLSVSNILKSVVCKKRYITVKSKNIDKSTNIHKNRDKCNNVEDMISVYNKCVAGRESKEKQIVGGTFKFYQHPAFNSISGYIPKDV